MAYTGTTVTIPLGQLGLFTDSPPGEIPVGALIKASNVSFETGMVTKAPGSYRYNTQVLPSGIVAAIDWWPDTITQRTIALCRNGSIYRDIGDRVFSGAVAIATGLGSPTPRSMFVEGGNETALRSKKLFLFTDGLNQVQVLSGDDDEFAEITTPATDWTTPNYPRFGFIHRNRLWAFMGQRAYASTTGDHEDFAGGSILTDAIYPGEGGDLIGGFVFKNRAFVFKEGGFVYYLDDSDTDTDNWFWGRLGANFGLSAPNGIVEILNDLYAVNESGGITSYSATQAFGDIAAADLLRALQIQHYMQENTSLSGLSELHAIYYAAKKQAFFTFRTGSRPTNDTMLHIDFNKQQPRASLWPKDQANCLTFRKDIHKVPRPIYGSEDGYIYLMDREDRLVGGSAYTGEFKTGHLDFRWMGDGIAAKNKNFDWLGVEFLPTGSWNVDIDVYIDGSFYETIQFLQDVRDDGLDSFTLGTDPLGREETQTILKPLHGSGRRISFHVKQSGSNQNFALASLTIGFRPSGEQTTRV